MNPSTFTMVTKTLNRWRSRLALCHAGTRLLCRTHGIQQVTDFQPLAKTVTLACLCKRNVFHRTDDEVFAYEVAKLERQAVRPVRVIGTTDDLDREHNWRHAVLVVEEVA